MHVILRFNDIIFDLKDDARNKALCEQTAINGLSLHTGQVFLPSHEKRTNDGLSLYDLF